jgi:hypothetical protein
LVTIDDIYLEKKERHLDFWTYYKFRANRGLYGQFFSWFST